MLNKKRIALLLTFSLLIVLASAAYGAMQWDYYYNDRFDFEIEYPGNIFYMEASDEDAYTEWVSFNSDDYTRSLYIEASLTPSSVTLKDIYNQRISEFVSTGATITYQPIEADWFALSGFEANGDIFYLKHISTSAGGNDYIDVWFIVRYPEYDRQLFDPIVERLVNTFRFIQYDSGG